MKAINEQSIPAEIEILTEANKINEYIMTRLRTKWGIEWSKIEQTFAQLNAEIPLDLIKNWQKNDWAYISSEHLILTETGALMADKLAADLFIV